MRNVELLEEVMQFITDYPEQHDQKTWMTRARCGTVGCFAGWACELSGTDMFEGYFMGAVKALGLTLDEADMLFSIDNSLDDLQLMVKDLVNGDELDPEKYRQRWALLLAPTASADDPDARDL